MLKNNDQDGFCHNAVIADMVRNITPNTDVRGQCRICDRDLKIDRKALFIFCTNCDSPSGRLPA